MSIISTLIGDYNAMIVGFDRNPHTCIHAALRLYSQVPQCETGKIELSIIDFSCPSSMTVIPIGEFTKLESGRAVKG